MHAIGAFFSDVKQEVGKVTWASMEDVRRSSVVVLIMMAVFSVFFLLVDGVFSTIIWKIIG